MLVYSMKIMRCVKSVITNYFMLDVRCELQEGTFKIFYNCDIKQIVQIIFRN